MNVPVRQVFIRQPAQAQRLVQAEQLA